MCLLIFKPPGKTIPFQYLATAYDANPHGSGIAFADGKSVRVEKDASWNAEDIAERLEYLEDNPALIHLRFATHGSNSNENCHPFQLPKKWAAAHNGIIDIKCQGDESDTRAFLRSNVAPALKHGANLADKGILGLIGDTIGKHNKMAFLHGSGEYGIANEEVGHWRDGVWYSNYTYEDYIPMQWNKKESKYNPGFAHYKMSELDCVYCGREIKKEFWINTEGNRAEMLCADCLEDFQF